MINQLFDLNILVDKYVLYVIKKQQKSALVDDNIWDGMTLKEMFDNQHDKDYYYRAV